MTKPRRTIDLNADLAEGFPWDERLLDQVSSANLSCGAHAGDRESIVRALRGAALRGVCVGAHPGYADREGFGRREQELAPRSVTRLILEQVEELVTIAAPLGSTVRYVKPHGALYNQAQRDPWVAGAVASAALQLGLPLVGMPGTALERAAGQASLPYIREGFADRRYDRDGRLLPRSQPGALLDDRADIEAQVLQLIETGVDTICLHGDHPGAIEFASDLRKLLGRHGIGVRGFLSP